MHQRIDIAKASPESYKALLGLENFVQGAGLERNHIHLIKLRASQINGCSYCVDMHSKEARHDGLSEQWVYMVSAWKESPLFTDKERALLGWTESLTNLPRTAAPDADFAAMKQHFTDEEIVKITVAIGTIGAWNRLGVGFRLQHPVTAA